MNKILAALIFALAFIATAIYATSPTQFSDQATNVVYANGTGVNGNLTIEVWDSLAGGSMLYAENFTDAVVNGTWNVEIGTNASNQMNLTYGTKYYRSYYINGNLVTMTTTYGVSVTRKEWMSPLGSIPWLYVISNGQNASFANLNVAGNENVTGNLIVYGYFFGQPLLGMLGSGLIESTNNAGSKTGDINITCIGLSCTYNAFKVRIMQGTGENFATYCTIPNGTLSVPDNTFATYYIDTPACNVVQTTYDAWFSTLMKTGGKWDFAYILTQNGDAEIFDSISLEQRRLTKLRILNYYKWQSTVISGFGISVPATIAAGFNISAGKTVFGMDVVDVIGHNISAADQIEMVAPNETGWQFNDNSYLNITACNNGTGITACTGNGWRRSFIFSIGYDEAATGKTSEPHALYPLLGTTYSSAANCLDTTTNPLTYTLPPQYLGASVMLYAYCTQRTATAWVSANLIDMRTVKSGSSTGGTDISGLVPYSGATGNVDLNGFNMTATYSNAKVNASYVENAPWASPGTATCTGVTVAQNMTTTTTGTTSQCITPPQGTVTSLTCGYGMNTSTITTSGTCNANDSVLQNRIPSTCTYGIAGVAQNGTATCAAQQGTGNGTAATGTATCAGVTVAQNVTTTTTGTTSQCITPPQGTVTSVTCNGGLTGGAITGSGTCALNTTGTAGTYGGANAIPVITTDANGRVSGVTTSTPAIPASEVTEGTFGAGNYTFPANVSYAAAEGCVTYGNGCKGCWGALGMNFTC